MNDVELEALWKKFGDYTIDENECIEKPFLHFSKGTDRMDIWHWFDRKHSKGLMNGIVNKPIIKLKEFKLNTNRNSILNVLIHVPLFLDVDSKHGGLEELAEALNIKHDPEITQEELAEKCSKAISLMPELFKILKHLYEQVEFFIDGDVIDLDLETRVMVKTVMAKVEALI